MLGVMNLRGNIVAVIDGRERFGKASAAIDEDARVLVLALDACACGMVVDCVTDVVDLKPEDLQPLTTLDAHAPDSPVAGVAYRNDGFLVLVDQDALLPEEIIGGTGDSDG
jgi:purine-binding chemotaxis protein CheW